MAYTEIDDPSQHFDILTRNGVYDSGGGTHDLTGLNFQPDFVWEKVRSVSGDHYLQTSSQPQYQMLRTNHRNDEVNYGNVEDYLSDGIQIKRTSDWNTSRTLVDWFWRGGGASPQKTYKVVVVSDSGNKYRFRNSGDTATFAQSAVTLDLQEGGTYVFDWSDSTAQGHPIRFSTTSDGTHGGGSEYTTGVVKDDSAYKTTITVAASAPTLYYYCSNHSGMGGQVNTNSTHGQTNFDGALLSVSQENTTAGFSIVTHTGTQSATTIGHGLGKKPNVILSKGRGNTDDWLLFNDELNESKTLWLNTTDSVKSQSTYYPIFWNSTDPTSSVIHIGNNAAINGNGISHIHWCFAEIQGYSKFGKFRGNANADGAFVYTGFKPAWLMIKNTGASGTGYHFYIWDNKRDTINVMDNTLHADEANAENTFDQDIDFVSNGFKIRGSGVGMNPNSHDAFYMAFAEHPFVSSKGVPVTAR